jgi:hypothetical protein
MPDEPPVDDHLRTLEERLARASAAAEQLAREAGARLTARATGEQPAASGTPPAGWQAPASGSVSEPDPVDTLAQALRGLLPPDLQQQLIEAVRELLLALRALIDWALERFEARRRTPVAVEDIPID